MKKLLRGKTLFFIAIIIFSGCYNATYKQEEVQNTLSKPNRIFIAFEDLTSPKFKHIIEKYQLDTIVQGETDEFRRILLLRDWIKSKNRIDDLGPYPVTDNDMEGVLDAALQGQGFHCGHFMTVQNAIMNGYGYLTRTLGAGPGVKGGPDGHHGINEIWSNDYNKWFLSDAKYNHHFEKNGVPLSVLEIRDAYLKNKAADIDLVKGPELRKIEMDEEVDVPKEQFAQTYTWVTWNENGDYFTAYPDYKGKTIMYDDDFYKNNTWFRDGVPAWIYSAPNEVILVEDRDAIEWTPNTIASKVSVEGQEAAIELVSDTPNFKTYQMKKLPGGDWEEVKDKVTIALKGDKLQMYFRVVNRADVTGPVHQVLIKKQIKG